MPGNKLKSVRRFQPTSSPFSNVNEGGCPALAPMGLGAKLEVASDPVKPELTVPVKSGATMASSKVTVPKTKLPKGLGCVNPLGGGV